MTRSDPYPSRVGRAAAVLPRKDPVIHGAEQPDGALSQAHLARFEQKGFLALDSLLGEDEVVALREEALRLRRALPRGAPEVVCEPNSGEVRSVFAIHRSNPVFARLAADPRILSIVTPILGSPAYIHQSRINYKPGFRGKEFYWHSDFETWHVEDGMPRMRAVSLSLSLLENNAYNGPLMLIPGSHQQYVSCAGRTPERHYEHSLRRQEYGVPDPAIIEHLARSGVEAPVGPPGSIVLFDCNVLHGSNGNITPWPRSNVFLVYNSVENTLEEPFSGQAPRPLHIASRDFTPLAAGA